MQLYLNLGGADQPKVVLRNFERLSILAGQTTTFSADITRRDVSNWDTVSQNWIITDAPKTVYVGASSRNLPLSAPLPHTGAGGGGGSQPPTYSQTMMVTQITDGQVQAPTAPVPPVSQIMDGLVLLLMHHKLPGSDSPHRQVQAPAASAYA